MAAVQGSPFRRALFWVHLAAGVVAGLVIASNAFTGMLMAFEHQVTDAASRATTVHAPAGASALPADQLVQAATRLGAGSGQLVVSADATAPASVARGREGQLYINPYTGAQVRDASAAPRAFFGALERWHRWLGLGGGPGRGNAGGVITGAAATVFSFLLLSGLYLWLPPLWRRALVWARLRPRLHYPNAKARDWGWHTTLSIWLWVPLLVIATSGVVMSFDWAQRLLYAAYGEQAPTRPQGPPGAPGAGGPGGGEGGAPRGFPGGAFPGAPGQAVRAATPPATSYQSLLDAAKAAVPGWQRITLPMDAPGDVVTLQVEGAGTPAQRQAVQLSTRDASLVSVAPLQGRGGPGGEMRQGGPGGEAREGGPGGGPPGMDTPAGRARLWLRRAHTGEEYGLVGQTIAALAAAVACLLVWTGLALAWRRLVVPLWRRAPQG